MPRFESVWNLDFLPTGCSYETFRFFKPDWMLIRNFPIFKPFKSSVSPYQTFAFERECRAGRGCLLPDEGDFRRLQHPTHGHLRCPVKISARAPLVHYAQAACVRLRVRASCVCAGSCATHRDARLLDPHTSARSVASAPSRPRTTAARSPTPRPSRPPRPPTEASSSRLRPLSRERTPWPPTLPPRRRC